MTVRLDEGVDASLETRCSPFMTWKERKKGLVRSKRESVGRAQAVGVAKRATGHEAGIPLGRGLAVIEGADRTDRRGAARWYPGNPRGPTARNVKLARMESASGRYWEASANLPSCTNAIVRGRGTAVRGPVCGSGHDREEQERQEYDEVDDAKLHVGSPRNESDRRNNESECNKGDFRRCQTERERAGSQKR